jgi:hypothetical protein
MAICLLYGSINENMMKEDIVQIKNPRINRYVKIDRDAGKILAHKKTLGPYKNIPIARQRRIP